MRVKNICRTILLFIPIIYQNLSGQVNSKYWVQFTDKKNSPYSITHPEQFLSQRAIQRRLKNFVPIMEQDIPVKKAYIDSVAATGVGIQYSSKWFNSITIAVSDETVIEKIKQFPFVKSVQKTADAKSTKSAFLDKLEVTLESPMPGAGDYGSAYTQIKLENGIELHNKGYMGKDVIIAIEDNGFYSANNYKSLEKARNENRILGTKDFVSPGGNVFNSGSHGAMVLSTIGADIPGTFIGTAPEASFWLIQTEDSSSEFPVEEDNWVAGAEFADSVGADIINTSLGYSDFDNPVYDHTYQEMNGETARISIGAKIAASKGIVLLVSAGNEGAKPWHYIDAPADAKGILTVGAVSYDSIKTPFSSFGPASDNRVKPEIMGMGAGVTVESSPGVFGGASGTSFSAPINSGLTACLIQAFPSAKSKDIIDAIIKSSNNFANPNPEYGYGIPDFNLAYTFLENKINSKNEFSIFPNPFHDQIAINSKKVSGTVVIKCFNSLGKIVFETVKNRESVISLNNKVANLTPGFYIITLTVDNKTSTLKAIKLRTPGQ